MDGNYKIWFGKYKGKTVSEVPKKEMQNYISWLKSLSDNTASINKFIQQYEAWTVTHDFTFPPLTSPYKCAPREIPPVPQPIPPDFRAERLNSLPNIDLRREFKEIHERLDEIEKSQTMIIEMLQIIKERQ